MQGPILIVDDEQGIADTLAAMLQHAGYQTLTAYGAAEALKILRTSEPVLIITDVIMPGMNGVDFAFEALALYPSLKVLLMSGNAVTQEIIATASHQFPLMAKPFPPRELFSTVASLLSPDAATRE